MRKDSLKKSGNKVYCLFEKNSYPSRNCELFLIGVFSSEEAILKRLNKKTYKRYYSIQEWEVED